MLPLNFHMSLKSHRVQQYFDPVGGARLSLKNSREPFERTCLNQYPGAGLEIGPNFYKTCSVNLGSDDFDHPVINRRRSAAYTHNAMYSSGETNLMKQTI